MGYNAGFAPACRSWTAPPSLTHPTPTRSQCDDRETPGVSVGARETTSCEARPRVEEKPEPAADFLEEGAVELARQPPCVERELPDGGAKGSVPGISPVGEGGKTSPSEDAGGDVSDQPPGDGSEWMASDDEDETPRWRRVRRRRGFGSHESGASFLQFIFRRSRQIRPGCWRRGGMRGVLVFRPHTRFACSSVQLAARSDFEGQRAR